MISDIRYWEKKASEGHYAIPHFNVWNEIGRAHV